MTKLLPLLTVSFIWFLIGWLTHGCIQPVVNDLVTLSPDQQSIVKAHQILQNKQLLLHQPTTSETLSAQFADAAINGMLSWSEDKYATLYGPLATSRYLAGNESAGGITNIWFNLIDDKFVVTDVPDGSSAALAGIQPGDLLLTLDDYDLQALDGNTLVSLFHGPAGSSFQLTVQRGDQIIQRQIKRAAWNYLDHRLINQTIGYLKTEHFFAEQTDKAVKTIFEEFRAAHIQGLIWDVRHNSGGSTVATEAILGYFMKPGTLLYSVQFNDGTLREFRATGTAEFAGIPIVVLTDEQTWSAGEMVAAAMAQNESTLLLGTKTGGKGIVQDMVQLDDAHMLQFTIAKWLTPTGDWIHEQGVRPSLVIEDDLSTSQDEVLTMAIDKIGQLLAAEK